MPTIVRSMRMYEHPRWSVEVLVKRYVTITVEAASEAEAVNEALDWHVLGDELVGDTIAVDVVRISRETGRP
jgi:hypothetical protein